MALTNGTQPLNQEMKPGDLPNASGMEHKEAIKISGVPKAEMIPGTPGTLATPGAPAIPVTPDALVTLDTSVTPATLVTPVAPVTPAAPVAPAAPVSATPGTPGTPIAPTVLDRPFDCLVYLPNGYCNLRGYCVEDIQNGLDKFLQEEKEKAQERPEALKKQVTALQVKIDALMKNIEAIQKPESLEEKKLALQKPGAPEMDMLALRESTEAMKEEIKALRKKLAVHALQEKLAAIQEETKALREKMMLALQRKPEVPLGEWKLGPLATATRITVRPKSHLSWVQRLWNKSVKCEETITFTSVFSSVGEDGKTTDTIYEPGPCARYGCRRCQKTDDEGSWSSFEDEVALITIWTPNGPLHIRRNTVAEVRAYLQKRDLGLGPLVRHIDQFDDDVTLQDIHKIWRMPASDRCKERDYPIFGTFVTGRPETLFLPPMCVCEPCRKYFIDNGSVMPPLLPCHMVMEEVKEDELKEEEVKKEEVKKEEDGDNDDSDGDEGWAHL